MVYADADWSSLPDDLLKSIAQRLYAVEDYVRFGRVCRSWHSASAAAAAAAAAAAVPHNQNDPKLPWLMMLREHDAIKDTRGFYSPSSNKIFHIYLPQSQAKRCWGSPFGWLVTLGAAFQLSLLNPLTGNQIVLPPLDKCRNLTQLVCTEVDLSDSFVNKVVLASSPTSPSSCYVMAIYSDYRKMAFVKLGDEAWTPFESNDSSTAFEDIIIFDDKFFALDCSENVLVFNSSGVYIRTVEPPSIYPVNELDCEVKYLVELRQEIYMVIRCLYDTRINDIPCWRTWGFAVFKLDLSAEKWITVGCLEGFCLFLGNNYSFSLQALDCTGFRANSIYFTDDYFGFYHGAASSYDMGIYKFEDHKIVPYPIEDGHVSVYAPPLWFRPCLS